MPHQPGESSRLKQRNGQIWALYCAGATQMDLAEKFGVSQATISLAIKAVQDSIPREQRQELIDQMVDYLRAMRYNLAEIAAMPAPPVTVGQFGTILVDPDTGNTVRDYSGRIQAFRTSLHVLDREINLLGLNTDVKVQLNLGEEPAAQRAAAEALAELHGGQRELEA